MVEAPATRSAIVFWALAAVGALALCSHQIAGLLPLGSSGSFDFNRVLLFSSLLPRAAVALLAGAALGLSGALLQQVLRNPIADPSTLGISAGAQLAMTAATLFAPALMEAGRETVAFFGGSAVVVLLLSLTWKQGLEPVTVVIAGMVISLIAIALSATLILANGEYMMSLLIWGSGSLGQQDWSHARTIALVLGLCLLGAFLLRRPLEVLELGDAGARSMGANLLALRLLALVIAVTLATTVTAQVGIIGFVGLAAPTFAKLCGARRRKDILLSAPVIGAIVLWLTDGLIQLGFRGSAEIVPTGAATALLGGPLLLYLVRRIRVSHQQLAAPSPTPVRRIRHARPALVILACLTAAVAAAALLIGRGPEGWHVATGSLLNDLLPFRGPRVVAAAAAGCMLAAAGAMLQRLTGNPMAGPEVLGVSAGAGVGLTVVLVTQAAPTLSSRLAGALIGVLLVLATLLAIAGRKERHPERLLLSGIAIGAFCSAIVNAATATGDARAFQLLAWISGSTQQVTWGEACASAVIAAALLAPLPFVMRWLDILPLGSASARAVGLPVRSVHLSLLLLSSGLTAAASLLVGPLSLVGLVAPHMARLAGFSRANQVLAAILIGSVLMVGADWLCRVATFPYQLPLGLFASLIGGPYLIWLLRTRRAG
ncbi:Fe(3+)-hydroxamate ABC transporter permease FhuB [Microvirga rosea]|uniref:Fe(3+)-hydroxamate ABC transporter permease FhuB n=1 Tax=Microvirga rosea TaxID=2715425 RepID=UPI001D0BC364|nr:Fe(3+)-hydroxamate ABC transporter permease FhuB [Microvirga rosea]MCB8821828.1 Fe(3+)-hydroxamate ABC transporter permease FhuB [Microvirga rosea]